VAFPVPLLLASVLLLVLLNGFFVASEFAIVKVRRTQLAARAARGEARAKLGLHVVDHLDAYLSATQLGITLASLGLGWIGEPALAALLEPLMHALGVTSATLVDAVAFALAFFLITMLHIVLGELAPKSLAIQRAEGVTLWTTAPLHVFYRVFRPFIWALNGLAGLVLRAFGIRPASEREVGQSEEELRLLMAEARTSRRIGRQRANLILRAFDLKDLDARSIMTPRVRVEALDLARSFDENVAKAEESGYSRFPLVQGSLDAVVGMVHYRDLARLARSESASKDLKSIARGVLFVPDTKPAEEVLAELLRRGTHMAIALDEHGGTSGLITLEDVFEELFGEIRDEFDTEEAPYRVVGDDLFVMDGGMSLQDAARALGVALSDKGATTLGGHVLAHLGHLPKKGEKLRLEGLDVTVREVDRRRIQSLEIRRTQSA